MRIIPGNTKVQIELFKGMTLWDMLVGCIGAIMLALIAASTLPFKWVIACVHIVIFVLLLTRIDSEPNYMYLLHILRHFGFRRRYDKDRKDSTLVDIHNRGEFAVILDDMFPGADDAEEDEDSFEEREIDKSEKAAVKALRKAEKAERKADDRLIRKKELTPEEEDSIWLKRAKQSDAWKAYKQGRMSLAELTEAYRLAKSGTAGIAALKAKKAEADGASENTSAGETGSAEAEINPAAFGAEENPAGSAYGEAGKNLAIGEKEEEAPAYGKSFAQTSTPGGSRDSWAEIEDISSFSGISEDFIEYSGRYYGAALEIPSVEYRFFSSHRRTNAIENGLGAVLRSLGPDYCLNLLKIERPMVFDSFVENEYRKVDELRKAYEEGFLKEDELKSRVAIVYDRINNLNELQENNRVVIPYYYLIFFDSDKKRLTNQITSAAETLRTGEMKPHRLSSRELALMLKYSNELDFNEAELESVRPEDYATWAMPSSVEFTPRKAVVSGMITHNYRVVKYPTAVNDAWLASLMTYPSTKVMVKLKPMDRSKSIKAIDRSLSELRGTADNAKTDSEFLNANTHIETLQDLLTTLQNENETLLGVNIYVTAYDAMLTENTSGRGPTGSFRCRIADMKKSVRRSWSEEGFSLNNMEFNQALAYVGSQVSAYDPMEKAARGIPSNTAAASFPWVFPHVMDEKGVMLGYDDGVPVFIDFFRRDSERVNSNMVVVGKSGSGKSFATKALLANLAADDSKIFILDPEDEYSELAKSLNGKYINVANAQFGRLNPFHIIAGLDDDEGEGVGSYATHLQFLEEFFKQILPDCDKDSLEYLNSLVDRIYKKKGIGPMSDLSALKPEDYPVFDDLYDEILMEFQRTDNEYLRTMLRTLMNYISKFSEGGRNAVIWNGPSSITTEENFTVFNFQSLLANRNSTVANAQMLLVLKYIDNEIIKNRDYNQRYGLSRKIVVVIDEAHVFIDTKYPVALDFMFQLAKRIRKYNGMQIVITQNIKDFVGSEEIARKSTAIINACQYSFIFSLAPNDMEDLCRLYEKAGGINENEQEQIIQAQRGEAFTVMSPVSRSSFGITVPGDIQSMFQGTGYVNPYFEGKGGSENWQEFIGNSAEKHAASLAERIRVTETEAAAAKSSRIVFNEVTEEEFEQEALAEKKKAAAKAGGISFSEVAEGEYADFAKELAAEFGTEKEAPAADAGKTVSDTAAKSALAAAAGVTVVQTSSRTEEILAGLVDKLGTASLADEIRRAVREEVEKEVAQRLSGAGNSEKFTAESGHASEGFGTAETFSPADIFKTAETAGSGETGNTQEIQDAFGSASEAAGAQPEKSPSSFLGNIFDMAENEGDTGASEGFDVLAFLAQAAAEQGPGENVVDIFVRGSESTMEITLEQLIQYNRSRSAV